MSNLSKEREFKYDPNITPHMTTCDIRRIMPENCYIDKIDKVLEIKDISITCLKSVTANEPFFRGHFPKEPVMPGVLQIETMVQAGVILLYNKCSDKRFTDFNLIEVTGARFRQKVIPGDVLIIETSIKEESENGIVFLYGSSYVGNKLVSEVHFTIQQS